MRRLVSLLIVAGVVALLSYWLAALTGTVTLALPDLEIRTGIGAASLILVLLVAGLMLAFRLFFYLLRASRRFGHVLGTRGRAAPGKDADSAKS